MAKGVPTYAAVLAGSLPPLVVQRQALPVRGFLLLETPDTYPGPALRTSHKAATGRTDIVLLRRSRVEMPSSGGAWEYQVQPQKWG